LEKEEMARLSRLLDTALGKALINAEGKVGRERSAELVNVLAVESGREAEGSIDNTAVESEEVLGNLAGTRVLRVEGSDEGSRLAVVVDLVMDGAHGEDSALELLESRGDLRSEAILEDKASLNFAGDDGQELSGARVGVRCIDT
jgi:hypothetical protein